MYYWNKTNFEGMKMIGDVYTARNGYEYFAKYCMYREQGLKKKANQCMRHFIDEMRNRSVHEQRVIASELSELIYNNAEIHQLKEYNLVKFLLEVFGLWIDEQEQDSTPYRWCGYFKNDISFYEKAIAIDGSDEMAVVESIKFHIKSIDFQTHHLSESHFIGTVENALQTLGKVGELIDMLKSEDFIENMRADYNYFSTMLEAWIRYVTEKDKRPFPEWCEQNGESFKFWNIVYYT